MIEPTFNTFVENDQFKQMTETTKCEFKENVIYSFCFIYLFILWGFAHIYRVTENLPTKLKHQLRR